MTALDKAKHAVRGTLVRPTRRHIAESPRWLDTCEAAVHDGSRHVVRRSCRSSKMTLRSGSCSRSDPKTACQRPARTSLAHPPCNRLPWRFTYLPHGREIEPFNCKQWEIRVHRRHEKKPQDACGFLTVSLCEESGAIDRAAIAVHRVCVCCCESKSWSRCKQVTCKRACHGP